MIITFETAKLAKEKGFGLGEKDYVTLHTFYSVDGHLNDKIGVYKREKLPKDGIYRVGRLTVEDIEVGVTQGMDNSLDEFILAPPQSVLHKWLREKYGHHVVVIPTITSDWTYKTVRVLSEKDNDIMKGIKSVDSIPPYKEVCGYDYPSYELALEHGLQEALKQIS
jgi:hypothetical protein